MDVIEETAVAVPTKVALTANPLVVVGVTAAVAGVVVAGAYLWRRKQAKKDVVEIIETH